MSDALQFELDLFPLHEPAEESEPELRPITDFVAHRNMGRRWAHLENVPNYVYRVFDEAGRLIYVGVTNRPTGRITVHVRYKWWAPQAKSVSIEEHPTRSSAEAAEDAAIKAEKPRWNVNGRAPMQSWDRAEVADYVVAVLQNSVHEIGRPSRHSMGMAGTAISEYRARTGDHTPFSPLPAADAPESSGGTG
jgi:hypothetical protein